MKTIIKYLQLPFTFSAEKLQAELNALNEQWVRHYNTADYEGDWSALPLRSMNGSLTNLFAENRDGSAFMDTILMDQCPYMKSITRQFPCEHKATRLLNLKPGAIIKEHRDRELGYEEGEARIHVPIITNSQVEFYIENERLDMKAGECWYINFDLPHRINNFGSTDRVHLVIDIVVNDAIREMFENVDASKKKIIEVKERISREDKEKIIEHLLAMNTPVSVKMAREMQDALQA
jgi:quercetin dioxygenase-like cupin family protein